MHTAGLRALGAKWNQLELEELARELRWAEENSQPYRLDLSESASEMGNPSAIRLHIPAVMLVANLLVGRFRDVDLEVRLPTSRGLNLQLARGGFFYALANHKSVQWVDDVPEEWEETKAVWGRPFHPDDNRMFREALAPDRNMERDSWVIRAAFQRYLLSVIHPHYRPSEVFRKELSLIARCWLSGRLSAKRSEEMRRTLADCVAIFYQIVVNVPDHAALRRNGDGCSLGQVYVTLGGGRESYNRLHFSVLDNGIGLPSRVNSLYKDRRRCAEESVRDALMGRLPGRVGGRGIGLNLVREIANHYCIEDQQTGGASRICIATNGDTHDSATMLDWHGGDSEPRVTTVQYLPIGGTLVWVSLGLDKRTPDEDEHQFELTFADTASK